MGVHYKSECGYTTTPAPTGIPLGAYCRKKNGLPCSADHSECKHSRCKCVSGYVHIPKQSNDATCVAQHTLPLGHYCSTKKKPCAADNSVCRYKCYCKRGFVQNG